jgi:predicted DNA binding CopG/RHH family protein
MAKRSLVDTVQDPNAKEAFIKEGSKKPIVRATVETKMLNTRIPKDLIKRIKVYCADNEITVQDFVTETLEKRLSQ